MTSLEDRLTKLERRLRGLMAETVIQGGVNSYVAPKIVGATGPVAGTLPNVNTFALYMQAGTNVITTNASSQFTITFPRPFVSVLVTVVPHIGDSNNTSATVIPIMSLMSLTAWGGYIVNTANGGGIPNGQFRVNWIAVGY